MIRFRVTPAGLWYVCAVMLWNFRACLYGNQSAQYFEYDPIEISEYLAIVQGEQ
jgi:hypothetical protein